MATITKAFSFTNSTVPYTAEGGSWAVTDGNKTTGSIVSGAESTNDPSGTAFGLQESITGKNSSNPGNFWEWTGTWENLGVPAGAVVTNVQLTSDWRVPTYTTGAAGQIGPAEYRDSAGTLLGTFMTGAAFSAANATWATRTGSTLSVASGQQASNTTIKLRLNNNLATGNSNSANVILQQDYIRVTVTYSVLTNVSATTGAVIETPKKLAVTASEAVLASQAIAVIAAAGAESLQKILVSGAPDAIEYLLGVRSQTKTFGHTGITKNVNVSMGSDDIHASPFVLSETAVISSITARTVPNTATGQTSGYRAGIYSDSGGTPRGLIGQTVVVRIADNAPEASTTFALQTAVILPPGTYWLAVHSELNGFRTLAAITGSGSTATKNTADTFADGLAPTFGTATIATSIEFLIFATYTTLPAVAVEIDSAQKLIATTIEQLDGQKKLSILGGESGDSTKPVTVVGSQSRIEAVGPVGSTVISALDALQGLAAILSSPYESQGGLVAVSQSAALALESLRAVAATGVEPIDALRKLAITSPFVAELLRSIVQTFEGD